MSRSGFPHLRALILKPPASSDGASREGKQKIVEMKSVMTRQSAVVPRRTQTLIPESLANSSNWRPSIIAKNGLPQERNIYAGALDGNSINDLNDVIRVAEQVSDYILIPNVNSDVTLGRYVAVAGQIQGEPSGLPEANSALSDFPRAIAREYYAEPYGGAL
ncbi:MAG: hypothetical protein ACLU9S_22175 [Oscillospiraceae bacterium]